MTRVEVCRIEHGFDSKQEANRWWEAKLATPSGEKVIHRVEYWDERMRSNYGIGGLLRGLGEIFIDSKGNEAMRQTRELNANAHARLIATLMQEGWNIAAVDPDGKATMMRRSV